MISEPPINSLLAVEDDMASWPKPWGNWFTQVWQQLVYLLNAPVETVTTAYQAVLTDSVILINGDITVTLPKAAEAQGKRITVKAINGGGGTRTVSGNGANIDGAATWTTTTQYAKSDFVSNGVQWFTV
jgi:hypothetical protein